MSVDSIRCRQCGSGDVTEYKAAHYVCGHCDTLFVRRIEASGTVAVVCESCGADSVGQCQQCGRRVCNRHLVLSVSKIPHMMARNLVDMAVWDKAYLLHHPSGESVTTIEDGPYAAAFAGGPPRCEDCRAADAGAAVDAEEDRARARARRDSDLLTRLKGTADPHELIRLLAEGDFWAKDNRGAIVEAWTVVAASGLVPATHELVVARAHLGWRDRISGWQESQRTPMWGVSNEHDMPFWLDASGGLFEPTMDWEKRAVISRNRERHRAAVKALLSRPGVSRDSQNWEALQHGTSEQVQRGVA